MNVKVYSVPTCPYCRMTKAYLAEKGIAYEDVDVSSDAARRDDLVKTSGQTGVPVIDIDGQVVIGFDEERLEDLLGKVE